MVSTLTKNREVLGSGETDQQSTKEKQQNFHNDYKTKQFSQWKKVPTWKLSTKRRTSNKMR